MASDERGESGGRAERRTVRSRTPDEERRRVRALTDAGVIAAMRQGDSWAWGEFGVRFEPLLLAYARRIGIPADVRRERVLDLLADEGMRLAEGRSVVPAQLPTYLAKALRHRYLNERRSTARRAAAYKAAAFDSHPGEALDGSDAKHRSPNGAQRSGSVQEPLITYVCSEGALRDALGPEGNPQTANHAVEAVVAYIRRHLTDEEQQILGWDERRIPHRQIADWLGVSYDAATKRIWRLKQRLQGFVADYCARVSTTEERRELERQFRHAGDDGVRSSMARQEKTANIERGDR